MHFSLLVGSYTTAPARGAGVSLLDFDAATGRLQPKAALGGLINPSWLRPVGKRVYAACEGGPEQAGLASLELESVALLPALALRGIAPVGGDLPCHLDICGRFVAVACYGSGTVVVHGLDADGVAGPEIARAQHHGSGPEPRRQAGPHAHAACFSPDGRWLLVPDLGTDAIWCHRFDAATGALGPDPMRWLAPAGSGPRHVTFSADGRHAVLVTELSRAVISLAWEDGALTPVDRLDIDGPGTAAALRWHPSGTLLAVSIRGSDRLALIGFDAATGRLALRDSASCGGAKPRDCAFSPCGAWLLAANQDGDTIAVLPVDAAAGRLTDPGLRYTIGAPSSLQFLD